MWNLRNKTKGKMKKGERERERERQTRKQTVSYRAMVTRVEVGGGEVGEAGDGD